MTDPRQALDLRAKKSQQEYKFYSILNNQPVHNGPAQRFKHSSTTTSFPTVTGPTSTYSKGKYTERIDIPTPTRVSVDDIDLQEDANHMLMKLDTHNLNDH